MKNEWLMGLLLLLMTFCGALGGAFFKYFALRKKNVYVMAGLTFYGLGALINIYLLKELPYTLVLPANAFTFVWTLMIAKWLFKETIGVYKIAGILFIVSGLIVLTL